ncbi:MAG TPA: tetratricopeptide repeat protein [Candidatus Eisenbacteria bacterium]
MARPPASPSGAARSPGSERPRSVARRGIDWLLWGLLALTLILRLWGVHERLPDPSLGINVLDDSVVEETDRTTMGRAWNMWGGGTRPLDLNPHTGGWPALSFYTAFALQLLLRAYHWLTAGGSSAQTFSSYMANHSDVAFLYARIACTLLGAVTVWLTYRLAGGLAGRPAGLLAGALLATNQLHVLTSQHIADPNLLALLFVLLAAAPLARITEDGTERDSVRAGAMIGFASACKYVPLVLGLPYLVAHARPARDGRGGWPAAIARLARRRAVWLGLLAILIAMFAATPFLFLDWKRTVRDFIVQRKSLFSDWVGQTQFPISLPTYFADSLPHALGWPAYLLGLAGLVLLVRSGRRGVVLALIPVSIIVANGMLKAAQERYVLPAVPFFFIGAALALTRGAEWLRARGTKRAAAAAAAAALALVSAGWTTPELIRTRRSLALPDSRHLARRWVNANVAPTAAFAHELYGPVFRDGERYDVVWPFFATQAPLARPAYHYQFLDGIRFLCLSGEISRRFDSEPEKYPVETAYYRWLRERGRPLWRSDPKTSSGPELTVLELPGGISTRAERDSLERLTMPGPTGTTRIALWCSDMAKLFLQLGEWDRAEEWATRGFRVGSPAMEGNLLMSLAVAEYRLGRPEASERAAARALRQQPKNYLLRYQRGLALHDLERYGEALAEYRAALSLRSDPRIYVNEARALAALGLWEEAIAELEKVPPEHFARATALHDLAILTLRGLHRPREAVRLARQALALDPNVEGADELRRLLQEPAGP